MGSEMCIRDRGLIMVDFPAHFAPIQAIRDDRETWWGGDVEKNSVFVGMHFDFFEEATREK